MLDKHIRKSLIGMQFDSIAGDVSFEGTNASPDCLNAQYSGGSQRVDKSFSGIERDSCQRYGHIKVLVFHIFLQKCVGLRSFDNDLNLISAGDVIKDGDTMGADEATRITVRRERSSLAPGQSVYRLYFPQTKTA